jgi:hypothetical protein
MKLKIKQHKLHLSHEAVSSACCKSASVLNTSTITEFENQAGPEQALSDKAVSSHCCKSASVLKSTKTEI